MNKRNQTQADLFGHSSIKEEQLVRLKELRAQHKALAEANHRKQVALDKARKNEAQYEWTHYITSCTRLK